MSADSVLAEAMARIEYKLDVLHEYFSQRDPMVFLPILAVALGSQEQKCPACGQKVEHQVDFMNKVVARKCGCSTGKIAPIDLGMFAPPVLPAKENAKDGPGTGDQEDRSNPNRRGRDRRR